MLTRDRAGGFLRARWPPLLALAATLAYAVVVIGFGLDFRPLHNDEGVTLGVASRPSALDVLRVAVDHRHGPPLHYLLVHAALAWRHDILGLRLPSALLGIAAVAFSYGFGRELVGRAGGAVIAVVTASSPITIHLGQFARGYTAMIAGAYASAWLMLILVRTGQARWVVPYALAALMLVSAHPFGLFALFSELVVMAGLAAVRLRHGLRAQWRSAVAVGAAALLGGIALLLLRHLYSPLQGKYGVGNGGPVIHPGARRFWERLGDAASGSGSGHIGFAILLGAATLLGIAALAVRNRRAAWFAAVWLVLPIVLLSVLTASSHDFAPERHLSFLLPGFGVAIAGFALELRRLARRPGPFVAAAAVSLLLAPGWVADHNELANFNADLRNASLYLASRFGPTDVLATTAGTLPNGEDPRLIGAYAVLAAPNSSPLSSWQHAGSLRGCRLAHRLDQHGAHGLLWMMMSVKEPRDVGPALRAAGARVRGFGSFLVVSAAPPFPTVLSTLQTARRLWHDAVVADPSAYDVRRMVRLYRHAAALEASGECG
jgi:hypothetical protein